MSDATNFLNFQVDCLGLDPDAVLDGAMRSLNRTWVYGGPHDHPESIVGCPLQLRRVKGGLEATVMVLTPYSRLPSWLREALTSPTPSAQVHLAPFGSIVKKPMPSIRVGGFSFHPGSVKP